MAGLLAILGKAAKGGDEPDGDEMAPDSEKDMSSSFEKEALSAAKDGDLEGMARALMGYAKSCMRG